jgi:hypothetical protein
MALSSILGAFGRALPYAQVRRCLLWMWTFPGGGSTLCTPRPHPLLPDGASVCWVHFFPLFPFLSPFPSPEPSVSVWTYLSSSFVTVCSMFWFILLTVLFVFYFVFQDGWQACTIDSLFTVYKPKQTNILCFSKGRCSLVHQWRCVFCCPSRWL